MFKSIIQNFNEESKFLQNIQIYNKKEIKKRHIYKKLKFLHII